MTAAYHGTPLTPDALLMSLPAQKFNFCISFYRPDQIELLITQSRSLMIDNGAFSAWKASQKRAASGASPVIFDAAYWCRFYDFVAEHLPRASHAWFVIPDVIDAGTQEQDALIRECPADLLSHGWPVWHLDEPLSRALRLIDQFGRVCFGSTAEYAVIGSPLWRARMDELFDAIIVTFGTLPLTHMLRGMQCQLPAFDYPFSSVDSTEVARNHNRFNRHGDLKPWLVRKKIERWEALDCPVYWPPIRVEQTALKLSA